ncbi:MAG: hypothetical protein JKX85_06665, partial [Phycisphaeraceae bacterium]|nr:hypothetical protein [Phycisphaeraceae bacterium]
NNIAVINIKKHSGESISNDSEIRKESRANASVLKTQIQDLDPDIIVAGSTVCWHSLTLDVGLFEKAKECPKMHAENCGGTILYHANHPSAWTSGGFNICEIQETIAKLRYGKIKGE